jgi:hypothetical protein
MTAQDIVTAALREIMIVRTGQTPATTELADGLAKLNRLLANWSTERLVVYAMSRYTGTLIPSQQSYGIGVSGPDFVTTRPISIHSANILTAAGGFVHPLKIVDEIEFSAKPGRSRTAKIPLKLWYQSLYPNGLIWLWPIPSAAAILELFTWLQLTQFATLATSFDLPPGYEQAVVLNLAVALAPQFERQVSQQLADAAVKAKAAITGVNAPPSPGVAEEIQSSSAAQPGPPQVAIPVQQ